MTPEQHLPVLYAPWVAELLGGSIPQETKATCNDCAMCTPAGVDAGPEYFSPEVKCCSYKPAIPNFLAGHILADASVEEREGRSLIEAAIANRIGISPVGLEQPASFDLIYRNALHGFGRAPAFRCSYYVEKSGSCGIWNHRPAVCTTWFCKFDRGATGLSFWGRLKDLLSNVESELAVWCVAELFDSPTRLPNIFPNRTRVELDELGVAVDMNRYRELWQKWAGREVEYYKACAVLVAELHWPQVVEICGPGVRILSNAVREAYGALVSPGMPARLQMGKFSIAPSAEGKIRVVSYLSTDPLDMSERLAGTLSFFRGQPVEEALTAIQSQLGVTLDRNLLQRLVDFGILTAHTPGK